MSQGEDRSWTVGALARAAGITVRTLHHYDRRGLVTASARTDGGHRRYTEVDVARLYRVLALRGLGFDLGRIAAVVDGDDPNCLLATARLQQSLVEQQLDDLGRLRSRLAEVIRRFEAGGAQPTDYLLATLETMAMTVQLTRIYTRRGDGGETDLADRSRVSKTDPRGAAVAAVPAFGIVGRPSR
jgi:DNA-binding transcriptional MerR regulator